MNKRSLEQCETPALILDEAKMNRNIERMQSKLRSLNVSFRPHAKTNKCIDVTRRLMQTPEGPLTVSTLREADYFAAHGVKDILYAVSIAPNNLAHVVERGSEAVNLKST